MPAGMPATHDARQTMLHPCFFVVSRTRTVSQQRCTESGARNIPENCRMCKELPQGSSLPASAVTCQACAGAKQDQAASH